MREYPRPPLLGRGALHARHADGVLRIELAQLGDESDQLTHHEVGYAAHSLR